MNKVNDDLETRGKMYVNELWSENYHDEIMRKTKMR